MKRLKTIKSSLLLMVMVFSYIIGEAQLYSSGNNTISGSYVGIGTSTPNVKLQVKDGDLRLDDVAANTTTNGSLFLGGTTYNGANGLRLFYYGQNSGNNLHTGHIEVKTSPNTIGNDGISFRADRIAGGTERMRILSSNGYVGIGVTNPRNRLEILGENPAILAGNSNPNTGYSGLRFSNLKANAPLLINPGDGVLTVDSNGNVIYVKSGAGGSIMNANNGCSVENNQVVLGNSFGSSTSALINDRELPMSEKKLVFTGTGNSQFNIAGSITNNIKNRRFYPWNGLHKMAIDMEEDVVNSGNNTVGLFISNHSKSIHESWGMLSSVSYRGIAGGFFCDKTESGVAGYFSCNINPNSVWNSHGLFSIATGGTDVNMGIEAAANNGTNGYTATAPAYGTHTSAISTFSSIGLYSYVDGIIGNSAYAVMGDVKNPKSNDYAGYFLGNVFTTGSYVPCDASLKENINNYTGGLDLLNRIEIKTYDYKTEEYRYLNLPKNKQIGVLANNIFDVIPQLTSESNFFEEKKLKNIINNEHITKSVYSPIDEKFKTVNYAGFVPILIAAIKELNTKVEKQNNAVVENDALKAKVADLESKLANYDEKFALLEKSITQICESGCAGLEKKTEDADALYQSIPNPTDDVAIINYYLAKDYQTAAIQLYTSEGKMVKDIKVSASKGNGSTKVSLADLSNGVFHYSLIVDGKRVGSKNLQVLKSK